MNLTTIPDSLDVADAPLTNTAPDNVTPIAEHIKVTIDPEVRRAYDTIANLIAGLPDSDGLLVEDTHAIPAWQILRDRDPLLYRILLGRIRALWQHRGLADLIESLVGKPPAQGVKTGPLPGYTAASIWDGYELPPYLVKRILSPGGLTVLFGQSGHLKSVTAIDLALSIATGTSFHGINTRRAGVLYVAGEGHAGIRRRVKAWLLAHNCEPGGEHPALYITTAGANLTQNAEQLRATVEQAQAALGVPIELIIIDTLAANFGPGDEYHPRDMTAAIDGARFAAQNAAILLVHHTGHGNQDRERGSYALIGSADFRLQATYDEPARLLELKWLKVKDDEIPQPLIFECRKIGLEWQDEDGEELTSVILERLQGATMPDAGPRSAGLGKNQKIVLQTLRTLYARAQRNLRDQGRDPAEAPILIDGWRRECERKKIDRNRWNEVLPDLQKRKLIAIEGVHVRLIEDIV